MKWFILVKKLTASSVNVSVVFSITAPVYFFLGIDAWRVSCVIIFFSYNLLLSHRCLGQMIARTYQSEPTNVAYAALYTASASTLLWWIWLPLDLALANGLFLQIPCLLIYGNTPHGLIARRRTLTEAEYFFESIGLRGQCPDCHKRNLWIHGHIIYCKACHATFHGQQGCVRRIELEHPEILPTGEIIPLPSDDELAVVTPSAANPPGASSTAASGGTN
jgi:hypothetical protein